MVALGVATVVDIAVGDVVVRAAVPDGSTVGLMFDGLTDELTPPVTLEVEAVAGTVAVLILDSMLDESEGDVVDGNVVARVADGIVNGVAGEVAGDTLGIDRAVGLLPMEMAVAVGKPVAAVTEFDAPQLATAHARQV